MQDLITWKRKSLHHSVIYSISKNIKNTNLTKKRPFNNLINKKIIEKIKSELSTESYIINEKANEPHEVHNKYFATCNEPPEKNEIYE